MVWTNRVNWVKKSEDMLLFDLSFIVMLNSCNVYSYVKFIVMTQKKSLYCKYSIYWKNCIYWNYLIFREIWKRKSFDLSYCQHCDQSNQSHSLRFEFGWNLNTNVMSSSGNNNKIENEHINTVSFGISSNFKP